MQIFTGIGYHIYLIKNIIQMVIYFLLGMEVAAYMTPVAKSVSVLVRGKAPFENILGIKIGNMITKVLYM